MILEKTINMKILRQVLQFCVHECYKDVFQIIGFIDVYFWFLSVHLIFQKHTSYEIGQSLKILTHQPEHFQNAVCNCGVSLVLRLDLLQNELKPMCSNSQLKCGQSSLQLNVTQVPVAASGERWTWCLVSCSLSIPAASLRLCTDRLRSQQH